MDFYNILVVNLFKIAILRFLNLYIDFIDHLKFL